MFGGISQMASLLKNLPKLQAGFADFQQKLGSITAEASSGGNLVTAKVNGRMELVNCRISEEAMRLNDREMIEDLVVAAVNSALAKVREQVASETQKLAGDIGLPPGMGLPGLG
jgi:nucleoid-associated protein EbfC